jgi:hypothetical protein
MSTLDKNALKSIFAQRLQATADDSKKVPIRPLFRLNDSDRLKHKNSKIMIKLQRPDLWVFTNFSNVSFCDGKWRVDKEHIRYVEYKDTHCDVDVAGRMQKARNNYNFERIFYARANQVKVFYTQDQTDVFVMCPDKSVVYPPIDKNTVIVSDELKKKRSVENVVIQTSTTGFEPVKKLRVGDNKACVQEDTVSGWFDTGETMEEVPMEEKEFENDDLIGYTSTQLSNDDIQFQAFISQSAYDEELDLDGKFGED